MHAAISNVVAPPLLIRVGGILLLVGLGFLERWIERKLHRDGITICWALAGLLALVSTVELLYQ